MLKNLNIFKGYNRFHLFVSIGMICLCFLAIVWGIISYYAGSVILVRHKVIAASAEDIWPYIQQPDLRDNWVVELIDHSKLSGQPSEPDSSRFLFYKRDFKRWHATEVTVQVQPNVFYEAYIESKDFVSRWSVRLDEQQPCRIKVTYQSHEKYEKFTERYFRFLTKQTSLDKMMRSLDVLEEWATKNSRCS